MSKTVRNAVTKTLKTEGKFSDKDAKKYEKLIFEMCKRIAAEEGMTIKHVYERCSYEKVGQLLVADGSVSAIVKDIEQNIIGWDSSVYDRFHELQGQEVSDLIKGITLQKGEFPCRTCGTKECYWWQEQTRSGDEGFTIFVWCSKCKKRYKK